ncbi:MAG: TadE family type IV pilus minor pilin [Nitriliruptoraceae bacterium]
MLSLEAVWVLPALALLVVGLVLTLGLVRDVLLLHEAARAGARTAATTTGALQVITAARQAAPELDLTVHVSPVDRRNGDLVTVWTSTTRMIGPIRHDLSARAVARVEPVVRPARPEVGIVHGPLAP